ncbi:MAG: SWIM zinc finger family protein [Pseudomonadota bacterium]
MGASLDFTYQYAFPSGVAANDLGGPQVSLATCNADLAKPYFFDGKLRRPRMTGEMLYVLSEVVGTHFFLPVPPNLDPVLTSNENLLRLEGFSGCCGVYARVDLPEGVFEGDCHGRGTTNVDFNTDMRAALLRLRDDEAVEFAVGADEVVLSKGDERTVEKKVKLPLRWIKGFSEVQAYMPRLDLKMEVPAADALRFLRSLPKAARPKRPTYAVSSGRSIRASQREARGAVPILGTHRVKVIEPLLLRAKTLKVWADDDSGASAWEVCYDVGSFFLLISPEVYRGFSGEGQVLANLANPPDESVVAQVRASLKWQSEVDPADLAARLNVPADDVEGALAVLGSRGLAGYDAGGAHYFHRELPFDLGKVEQMQPRLLGARKLIEADKVRLVSGDNGSGTAIYEVEGTGTVHRVRLSESGEACTCPWFSKYQGQRGPCKHILAASMMDQEIAEKGAAQ